MPIPIKLGVKFTAEELELANKLLNDLMALFNSKATVNLTKDERKAAQSVSEGRLPFVERCYNDLLPNYKAFVPNFTDQESATFDYEYMQQTRSLILPTTMLLEIVTDHHLASGQLSYQTMRDYYHTAQRGAERNVPGADTVVDSLAPLFEQTNTAAPAPKPGSGETTTPDNPA